MAEHKRIETAEDKEYRSKSINHMFKGALYGSLGMASFFGVLTNIVGMVLKSFAVQAPASSGIMAAASKFFAAETATASAGFLGMTPLGWAVIGGLMAIGVAGTYMAQVEATKLKEVQDEGLARKSAAELCKHQAMAKTQGVEYSQNHRTDGKKWEEAIARPQPEVSRQLQ